MLHGNISHKRLEELLNICISFTWPHSVHIWNVYKLYSCTNCFKTFLRGTASTWQLLVSKYQLHWVLLSWQTLETSLFPRVINRQDIVLHTEFEWNTGQGKLVFLSQCVYTKNNLNALVSSKKSSFFPLPPSGQKDLFCFNSSNNEVIVEVLKPAGYSFVYPSSPVCAYLVSLRLCVWCLLSCPPWLVELCLVFPSCLTPPPDCPPVCIYSAVSCLVLVRVSRFPLSGFVGVTPAGSDFIWLC